MKQLLHKIARYFLPVLFISYIGCISLFTHSHVVNGVTIVHSHPYKPGTEHEHTTAEFQLIHMLSSIETENPSMWAFVSVILFSYCSRLFFPSRHFKDILTRFENLLNDYFQSEKPQIIGLPSVQYCADSLHLSPNYFGDLIKKETGNSAQEYIQAKLIGVAKDRIFDTSLSVSEIAYSLGFKYPQHFSRLFKQKVGVTPNEYRMRN